jgi:hypothetical protein
MYPNTDIGGEVAVRAAFAAQNSAAQTISGTSMDRAALGDPNSCVLQAQCGDASGTPSSFSVDAGLEHSDTGSGGWTAVSGTGVAQLVAAGESRKSIDLSGCKRYVRMSMTVAFVSGTSPKVPVAGTLVFGGLRKLPAP